MKLFDLKAQHKELLDKAESFLTAAESAGRAPSVAETENMNTAMNDAQALAVQITAIEKLNTLKSQFGPSGPRAVPAGARTPAQRAAAVGEAIKVFSADYLESFGA